MPHIVAHRNFHRADETADGSANHRLVAVHLRLLERRPGRGDSGLRLAETYAIANRGGSHRGARVLHRRRSQGLCRDGRIQVPLGHRPARGQRFHPVGVLIGFQ